jgi:hypothetical protein
MFNAINYNAIFLDEINFKCNDNNIYFLLNDNETFILCDFIIIHRIDVIMLCVLL